MDYPIYFKHNHIEHEQGDLLMLIVSSKEAVISIEGEEYIVPEGVGLVIFPKGNYLVREGIENIKSIALAGTLIDNYKNQRKYYFIKDAKPLIERYLYILKLHSDNLREQSILAYSMFTEVMDSALISMPLQKKVPLIVKTAINTMKEDSSFLYNIDEIAQEIGVSLPYLSREFKKYTGIGPAQYLRKIRIENAKVMLGDFSVSITMVGQICGFSGVDYFSRVFKKETGVTPSEYRKSLSAKTGGGYKKSSIPDEAYL